MKTTNKKVKIMVAAVLGTVKSLENNNSNNNGEFLYHDLLRNYPNVENEYSSDSIIGKRTSEVLHGIEQNIYYKVIF